MRLDNARKLELIDALIPREGLDPRARRRTGYRTPAERCHAAHAMAPNLGQGANRALVDGVVPAVLAGTGSQAESLNGRVITHQQRSPRWSAVCPPHPEAGAGESSFVISTPLSRALHPLAELRQQQLEGPDLSLGDYQDAARLGMKLGGSYDRTIIDGDEHPTARLAQPSRSCRIFRGVGTNEHAVRLWESLRGRGGPGHVQHPCRQRSGTP
jgi:hypothetical protein